MRFPLLGASIAPAEDGRAQTREVNHLHHAFRDLPPKGLMHFYDTVGAVIAGDVPTCAAMALVLLPCELTQRMAPPWLQCWWSSARPAACLGAHRESCCFHFRASPPRCLHRGGLRPPCPCCRCAAPTCCSRELVGTLCHLARCSKVERHFDYRQARSLSVAATLVTDCGSSRPGLLRRKSSRQGGLPTLKLDPRSAVLLHIEVESGDASTKLRSYGEPAASQLLRQASRLLGLCCLHLREAAAGVQGTCDGQHSWKPWLQSSSFGIVCNGSAGGWLHRCAPRWYTAR